MARTNDKAGAGGDATPNLAPLKLTREFHASRETVFRAWTTAEHVKRWFCPEGYTVPEARVEMQAGGAFDVCMRAPDGTEHWSRGNFVEVVPDRRLVFEGEVADASGAKLFHARTEVDFFDAPPGTRLEITQTYRMFDPTKAWMVGGAPEGWRTTLDKLEREVLRMQGGAETPTRSVAHGTFHLERVYDAPAALVWRALTNEADKGKWFGAADGRWELIERYMDVRVGGREREKARWQGGVVSTFDALYHDVIANERLVYSYEMHLDEKKISISLATMQLIAEAAGRTKLKLTEQGAFLDGYDDAGSRERGTAELLDALGKSLKG